MKRHLYLDLSDYVPYLVNRFGAALVERFGENGLAERNLSIAKWRVLAVLSQVDRQRLTDLSLHTSIEISTLSRIVTRLVAMGLVKRTRNASNSREVTVELTGKGVVIASEMIPIALEIEQIAIAGVPKRDLATVKRTLLTMHGNVVTGVPVRSALKKRRRSRGASSGAPWYTRPAPMR